MAKQHKKQQPITVPATQKPKKPAPEKASTPLRKNVTFYLPLAFSIIALAAVAFLVIQQRVNDSNTALVNTNVPANSADLQQGQWALVNLSSGDHYYGRLTYEKSLGAYLLWNAWRPNNDSSTSTTSTATVTYSKVGSELHKPLPYLVINPQVLYTWQTLSDSSSVLRAIKKTDGYNEVAEPKIADIQAAKLSAVFLADDSVLFGTIVHRGAQVGVKDAYIMTRKNSSAKADQPIKSLNDLQLVPQKNITPGSSDTLWVNPDALVMYETLSKQSPVVQAIQAQ